MEKPSDSLNKAEHPATQPGCLSPNECGRDTSLSSAGRQAPWRRESPVPGKPPQTSGCWLRLRPHAASTPLLGGCLPPPSCTCGQKGLWRRLVDICAHSTAPGFPLGLAQQHLGCIGPGQYVASGGSKLWGPSKLGPSQGVLALALALALALSKGPRALRPTYPEPHRSNPQLQTHSPTTASCLFFFFFSFFLNTYKLHLSVYSGICEHRFLRMQLLMFAGSSHCHSFIRTGKPCFFPVRFCSLALSVPSTWTPPHTGMSYFPVLGLQATAMIPAPKGTKTDLSPWEPRGMSVRPFFLSSDRPETTRPLFRSGIHTRCLSGSRAAPTWTSRHRESGDLLREHHGEERGCSPTSHHSPTFHAHPSTTRSGSQSPGKAAVAKAPAPQLTPANSQTKPTPPFHEGSKP